MQKSHPHQTRLSLLLAAVLLLMPFGALATETAAPSPAPAVTEAATEAPSPVPTEAPSPEPDGDTAALEAAAGKYLNRLSGFLQLQADAVYAEHYRQYLLLRAELLAKYGEYASWSLEHRAELDQLRVDNGLVDAEDKLLYALPTGEELTKDEALEIARETVREEFELEERSSIQWIISSSFYRLGDERMWAISLQPNTPSSDGLYYTYYVEIDADSGDAVYFAATEPTAENPEETPEPTPAPDEPSPEDIPMEEALAIGQAAIDDLMAQEPRWDPAFLPAFATTATFVRDFSLDDGAQGDVWIIQSASSDPEINDYFNIFWVLLDAKTGEVLRAEQGQNG